MAVGSSIVDAARKKTSKVADRGSRVLRVHFSGGHIENWQKLALMRQKQLKKRYKKQKT